MGLRNTWLVVILGAGLSTSALADELMDRITINGYTNFEFEKQLTEEGFGDTKGSFDADQLDLVFQIRATDRVRVAADLSWEHGSATEEGRGNQALEYGFVEYTVKDFLKVKVGKMLTPFGIFNEFHTAKPAFLSVKEAPSLNKTERVVKGALRLYPRWGAGIALHGDVALKKGDLSYDVFVANGAQPSDLNLDGQDTENPFELDSNSAKSVTFRVRYEPLENLRMGYSFYVDGDGDLGFERLISHGLELEWGRGNFHLQAEGAHAMLRLTGQPEVNQLSGYLQPSYQFKHGITPYLRWDWVDPNRDLEQDSGNVLTFGVNLELAKNFQIKAEDNRFAGGEATRYAQIPDRRYHEFKAAVVLGF